MSIESDTSNNKPRTVQDIIRAIEMKSANGRYVYRGEPECHEEEPYYGKVSSSLWREYRIEAEYCDIEVIQSEMLNGAKKHLGHLPQHYFATLESVMNASRESSDEAVNFEILTQIQHYGGNTNLIDFTTDYFIALFFACDGSPDEDGRVILQKTETITNMIKHPRNPQHRVIAQKSVFIRPPNGFIEPNKADVVRIPANFKQPVLQHLRTYHDISKETIYNDLYGFIRHQGLHEGAYTRFFRGVACQNVRQYAEAIEHYTKAIRVKPDFAEAYYNRGIAYSDKGDCDSAIADYTKAIELNPGDAAAYSNRGWVYGNAGDYEKALADFTKAIQLNPNYAKAYYNCGWTYEKKGDYDRTIANYTKAIKLNPDFANAYSARGNAHQKKSNYDRAIADFTKAIELSPNHAIAYYNRGNAYRNKSDSELAIKDYTKAIQVKPNFGEAYYNRGNAYISKSEYNCAIADFSKAIQLKPGLAEAYNNRGLAYYGKGDYKKAIVDFNRAIDLRPDDAKTFYGRGDVYGDIGAYDKAIKDYNKAIRLNPRLALVLYKRGEAWLHLGDWGKAKSDLTAAGDMGMDIIVSFHNNYRSIANFEQITSIRLPADIVAMLTPPQSPITTD